MTLTLNCFGLGFRVPNQDAQAIGRGNAFTATADNPSALYYNPAGITQLEGQNFQVGSLFYLGVHTEYEAPTGAEAKTRFEVLPIPEFYYAASPKELPVSIGLGVYMPFGLGLEWPEQSVLRPLAIEGRLEYVTVNPVVAYKLGERVSLAIGPTFNYSHAKLRTGVLFPTDEFVARGDGWGYGFNAGVLWQPHEQWSLGASYRSASTIEYTGSTEVFPYVPRRPTTLDIEFPHIVMAGISYRPTPQWNLEADVDWADWSSVDRLALRGSLNPLTLQEIVIPLEWQASWMYEAGVTRYFKNGLFASAGYFFSQNSTSEKFFHPILPDTDLHVASVGVGYKGARWRAALAGQYIFGGWREVNNSQTVNPAGQGSANGRYRTYVPTVSFSIGYHF